MKSMFWTNEKLSLMVAWSSSVAISCFKVQSSIGRWFDLLIAETQQFLAGTPGVLDTPLNCYKYQSICNAKEYTYICIECCIPQRAHSLCRGTNRHSPADFFDTIILTSIPLSWRGLLHFVLCTFTVDFTSTFNSELLNPILSQWLLLNSNGFQYCGL